MAAQTSCAASTALDSWSASVVLVSAESVTPGGAGRARTRGAHSRKASGGPAAIQSFRLPSAFWAARCSSSHEASVARE